MSEAKARETRRTARRKTRTNVRSLSSSFVGRDEDVAGIAMRFAKGARLVTITGPGGLGKTRLALRVAETMLDRGPSVNEGGVWFCDLTEARTRSEIAATVASALGVRIFGERADEAATIEELGVALESRGVLFVILDNLKQLVAEARNVIGAWLGAAPDAKFLATSRIALDLPGEESWPLQPSRRVKRRIFSHACTPGAARPDNDAERSRRGVDDAADSFPCEIDTEAGPEVIHRAPQ